MSCKFVKEFIYVLSISADGSVLSRSDCVHPNESLEDIEASSGEAHYFSAEKLRRAKLKLENSPGKSNLN